MLDMLELQAQCQACEHNVEHIVRHAEHASTMLDMRAQCWRCEHNVGHASTMLDMSDMQGQERVYIPHP